MRNALVPLQRLYWEHRNELDDDPTIGIDLPDARSEERRAITARQALELVAALPDTDKALWATALFAGLRLGELRGLRVGDVDLDKTVEDTLEVLPAPTISVSRGWDVKEGEITPKSDAGFRDVPIPATLAELLRAHVERTGRSGDDLIFGRADRLPFTDSERRAGQRSEVPPLRSRGDHHGRERRRLDFDVWRTQPCHPRRRRRSSRLSERRRAERVNPRGQG